MRVILEFISKLVYVGVKPNLPLHEQQRIIKLNKVYLLTIPACVMGSLWSLDSIWFWAISMSISLFMQGSLLFHHWGYYRAANLYASLVFNILCSVLAIAFNGTTGTENYLFIAMFTLQMQYHFRRDISRTILCIIIFGLYVFIKTVNHYPHAHLPIPQYAFVIYIQNIITIFLLILFLMHEYQTLVDGYQQEIEQQNDMLVSQKKELIASNQVKDKLFSIIGHDLSKPLASVRGMISLISQNLLSPKEQDKYLNQLLTLIDSTDLTLKNLIEWGNQQTLQSKREPLALADYVEQTFQLFQTVADQKKIKLFNHVSPNTYVYADKNQLAFILRNLVNNAVKFTYIGGKIEINVEDKQNYWVVQIIDNGMGIKSEYLPNLFQSIKRFSTQGTAKETGTGIGLPLCKQFVEANEGALWVKSEEGKGSTFYFSLKKAQFHTDNMLKSENEMVLIGT